MFWKNTKRTIAIAVTFAIVGLSMPTDAFADRKGKRHYRDGRGVVHHHHHHRQHKRHKRRNDAGVAVAAGIVGLTVGALIAGSANQRHYQPRRVYRAPRDTYYAPRRAYRAPRRVAYAPEPFTAPWYRYCANKYRSFDARSGTFMSYSGVRKLCR